MHIGWHNGNKHSAPKMETKQKYPTTKKIVYCEMTWWEKMDVKSIIVPRQELLSAEIQQVVLSSSPLSIWLQWNLCWAGTNKPNLVSNIISLEPNLISAPVCFSRPWLSLPSSSSFSVLSLPLSIRPSFYASVTCPPSWRRWVSALAWEPHYPDWRLCFPCESVRVRGCVCVSLYVCVYAWVCVLEEDVRETVICYISKHSSPEILWVWVDT